MRSFLPTYLTVLLLLCGGVMAQAQTVTGTVTTSEDGSAVPGVSVSIKGTTSGGITDINGKYSVNAESGSVLVFSFIGYAAQEITVGSQSVIDVVLEPDVTELNEVVVTAFGIEKEEKALGYSTQQVGADEFTRVRETNVVNSLSGKVAGVSVTRSSTGLGGSSKVIIRGNSSLTGNNQPLYVVDGIPIDNSSNMSGADEWGNGTGDNQGGGVDLGGGISDLNPDDIESMNVLKGASATALYGSRGQNGVIMITTKKGTKGKGIGVDFSTNYTTERAAVLPEFQNEYGTGSRGAVSSDYATILTQTSWGPKMDGSSQPTWTGDGATAPYTAQPDNFKDFFETGSTFTNSLALSGGGPEGSVRVSLTDVRSKGIVPNNTLDRTSVSVRGLSNLGKKLKVDSRISYVNQKVQNKPTLSLWPDNPILTLSQMGRNVRNEDLKNYLKEDGSSNTPLSGFFNNPYYVQKHNFNESVRNRVYGFVSMDYAITDWLSIMGRIGSDYKTEKYRSYLQIGHTFRPGGEFNDVIHTTQETNTDFLLKFNKDLSENFSLSLNFGGNHRFDYRESIGHRGSGWIAKNTFTVSNLSNPIGVSNITRKKVNSLYGFGSVSYKNILFVDFSGRNDWSSALSEENRSYFYPSVSSSFILSDAIDMNNDVFNLVKLRASWAQVGNDLAAHQLFPVYNFQSGVTYNGYPVASNATTKLNPNILPEETTSFEAGFQTRLFNLLDLDFTYYNASTVNQILNASTMIESGYQTAIVNSGEIVNKGFEIALGANIINKSEFKWDLGLNFSKNSSEVKALYNNVERYVITQGGGGGKVQVVADIGKPYGELIGFTHKRDPSGNLVYTSTGLPVASDEMVSHGNINPDFLAGLTNTLTYKNFTLYFLIDMKKGGSIVSVRDAQMNTAGTSLASVEGRENGLNISGSTQVTDAGTGEVTFVPLNLTDVDPEDYHPAVWNAGILDDFVYDAGFVKMREISLSYNLSSALVEKTPFNKVSLSLIGRNLFFFSKSTKNFDPEASFSTVNGSSGVETYALPTTRSFGFNLNLSF